MEDYIFLVVFGVVSFGIIVIGISFNKSQKKAEEERIRFAKNARKRFAAAKSVKKIQWKDQFVIDKDVIDDDHRTLFKLINDFNEGIVSYITADQMLPHLTAFTDYTQTHFLREEKLQQECAFPFRDDHQKEHRALIEKFNGLKLKALKATEDNVTDVAVEIGNFLQEWLTGHVIESDLPLKPYMERAADNTQDVDETDEQAASPLH